MAGWLGACLPPRGEFPQADPAHFGGQLLAEYLVIICIELDDIGRLHIIVVVFELQVDVGGYFE